MKTLRKGRFFMYDFFMKKLLLLLAILSLVACTRWGELDAKTSDFIEAMELVSNIQEEADLLESIWFYAYHSDFVTLSVEAIDAEGNKVIQDIDQAIDPVSVTIHLSAESVVSTKIEFVARDKENIYILLKE